MRGDIRKKLADALDEVDRPGSFCVDGDVAGVPPGLEVEGLGPVGLPLAARKAKELIKHCRRAPHGRGAETVVDPAVRRVWKLGPGRFSITNPDWDRLVREAVARAQEGLGLEKQKLESHLHDLLLYGPGDFFLPHRDGEKVDRMVATLVIALPSSHEGGELVIRHDGRERSIDLRGDDPARLRFAAFYADCEHEIRPITRGYRLCLVYNLTLAKPRKKIPGPGASGPVEAVARLLEAWAADESAGKLAVTLEHQYTQDGLAWDALKGEDRARAQVLVEAARQAGCVASLALLTLYESGEGEEARPRSRSRRRWDDDDEEDEGDGDYEMGEIYETRLTAAPRVTGDGQLLPIGELGVDEDDVLDPDTLKEVTPEEEFEGYTGNEGMTLERWYRHAAVVLWPARRHFEVLCERDSRLVIPVLKDLVDRLRRARGEQAAALRAQGLGLAAAILGQWKRPGELHDSWATNRQAPGIVGEPRADDLLGALDALGEPALIGRFVEDLMVKDPAVDPGQALASTCRKHGWSTFRGPLRALMRGTTADSADRNIRLLESFCTVKGRKQEGWGELCSALAGDLVAAIEAVDRARASSDWYAPKVDRGAALAGLARSLLAAGQHELLGRFASHALAAPKTYPLTTAHLPALVTLRPWLGKHLEEPVPALSRWVASCREQLESLTSRMPQEPKDFRRSAGIACPCAECADLKRFLGDPAESAHRFRAREKVREHLEHEIRRHKLDLDLKTERTGSPHTLVCTKNMASYRERLKTYHENLEHLATLRAIEAGLPA